MRIDRARPADIRRVALAMRENDLKEFLALSWAEGREALADDLADRYTEYSGIVAYKGQEPVAVGAMVERRPNVLTLGFFATDRLPEIALPLTRFIKRRLFAPMVMAGAHRIEAVSMVGHHAAHRWIETLGLQMEALCRGYGRNGEDFVQFAWVKDVCSTGDSV